MRNLLFIFLSFAMPFNAYAGLQDTLNGMFLSNSTAPSNISTADRGGVSLGGFVARTPIKPINLVAFDPPRLSAGCGGMDMYAGSFSFINADQFTALVRAIMANAIGLLFQAALKAINPMIADLVNYFQDVVNGLNKMLSNTCALAHQLTDGITGTDSKETQQTSAFASFSTAVGAAGDRFKKSYESRAEKKDSSISAEKQPEIAGGNVVWRSLMRSSAHDILDFMDTGSDDDNNFKAEVMMSLLGTEIQTSTKTTADNATDFLGFPPILSGTDLVNVGLTKHTMNYYKCADGNNAGEPTINGKWEKLGCPVVVATELPFSGTYPYVLNMLYGDPAASWSTIIDNYAFYNATSPMPDSIVGKLRSGGLTGLTASQKQFMRTFPGPIVNILLNAQTDPNTVTVVLNAIAKYAAYEMAHRIAKSARVASKRTWENVTLPMPDLVKQSQKSIDEDVNILQEIMSLESDRIRSLHKVAAAVRETNTNAGGR